MERGQLLMQRLIALIIMVIPGIIAVIGIKLIRDMLFGISISPFPNLLVQLIAGILFIILGLWFIGGFILHRDRKRNKVQSKFKNK
jgi:putative Mn2+ efflux pump MntP